MDYTVTRGTEEDYEDIIDLGNYAFGIDFPPLLPKLYKNHSETAQYHHIVRVNGRIRAMVGSFPLNLTVGGTELSVRGIGTVSVHRYSRNYGYMKILMNDVMEEMRGADCDLAVLLGQRQRYEHWDFTLCGVMAELNFNASNLKHFKDGSDYSYEFRPCGVSEDEVTKAAGLHNSQHIHARRDEKDFLEISSSWDSSVYSVYKKGVFEGYLAAAKDGSAVHEAVFNRYDEVDKVIFDFMKFHGLSKTKVTMWPYKTEAFLKLAGVCENYSIINSADLCILNIPRVIKACMELKNRLAPLTDGALTLKVEGRGSYRLEVSKGRVSVEDCAGPEDLALPYLEAMWLIFSSSGMFNLKLQGLKREIREWFPLPLYFPNLDAV
jgi:predicted N-acetyltransferase YhbS